MEQQRQDVWIREVQGALRRYQRLDDLGRYAARDWPAVQVLRDRGIGAATAIRQVIDEALATLEADHLEGVYLLREHYLQGLAIETMAAGYNFDASNLYRRCNRLVRELAVVIAERNREVERQGRSRRFNMRQPVVGFERLAAEIAARLRDPAAPAVVILAGMGGLGKTTLARLVAARCAEDDAFAGVLWASAKQVDFDVWAGRRRTIRPRPVSAGELLVELARELGIEAHGDQAALRNEVRAHCKRSPYLIVFDNLETAADLAALAPLIELLVDPSRMLITTRDAAFDALPATLPRHYHVLDELDAPISYQLLREAAAHIEATQLAQAADADLGQIYNVTGGNPLALWLVAGQARGMPWANFIQDLVEHCPRGSKGYELYDYLYRRSWEQLSDDARTVLFAMHRCEAGAEYDLLFELSDLPRPAFHAAVDELRCRMLLLFDEHYSIHRLTYTFLRVVIAGWWA